MKVFKDKISALDYIEKVAGSYSGEQLENIHKKGITKVNNEVVIVDELGILD